MEAILERTTSQTVRCRAILPSTGIRCNAGLWRPLDADLLEVSHALRSGRRLTLTLPLAAAQQTFIVCHECGTKWWPASTSEPRQTAHIEAAIAVISKRPPQELLDILDHGIDEATAT